MVTATTTDNSEVLLYNILFIEVWEVCLDWLCILFFRLPEDLARLARKTIYKDKTKANTAFSVRPLGITYEYLLI